MYQGFICVQFGFVSIIQINAEHISIKLGTWWKDDNELRTLRIHYS